MPNDLLSRLDAALSCEAVNRHSLFQLKHFILGKETTVQGRIWQCLREMRVRKDSLDAVELEIEEAKDKFKLLLIEERSLHRQMLTAEKTLEGFGDPMPSQVEDLERLQIKYRMAGRQAKAGLLAIEALEQKKKDLEVEAAFFVEEFDKLSAGHPVKSLDDEDAQKEYWTSKLFQEVHIKSLLGQPLEPDLVKTVLSLPDDSPVKAQMVSFLNSIRDAKVKVIAGEQTALTK